MYNIFNDRIIGSNVKNLEKELDLVDKELNKSFVAVQGTYNGFKTDKSILFLNKLSDITRYFKDYNAFFSDGENLILNTTTDTGGIFKNKIYYIYALKEGEDFEKIFADRYKAKEFKKYLSNITDEVLDVLMI